eukprot:m.90546 g.90546  ORF g.90546 m.90546 type:complete len:378 (+) comp51099_c0_seq22:145-1278(+)
MQNWKAARTGVTVTSVRSNRGRTCLILSLLALAALALLLVTSSPDTSNSSGKFVMRSLDSFEYNDTYPHTPARDEDGEKVMPIGIIADLDHDSKHHDGFWFSYFRKGTLIKSQNGTYHVAWEDEPLVLQSYFNEKGRGCELSDLQFWNGRLFSVDDRTGVVYEILGEEAIPRYILTDGDGSVSKGFKAEWMTVKDQHLWVGGMGKEWTTPDGVVVNLHPQWIKVISPSGLITHVNWVRQYDALRLAMDMPAPGYVIHESAVWSDVHQKWFFLPRKASKDKYEDVRDEGRGTNHLLKADEDFRTVEVLTLGPLNPIHGFSSFKFIPGSNDQEIVALKTQEYKGEIATFIAVFTLDGRTLMNVTKIGTALVATLADLAH